MENLDMQELKANDIEKIGGGNVFDAIDNYSYWGGIGAGVIVGSRAGWPGAVVGGVAMATIGPQVFSYLGNALYNDSWNPNRW